MLLEFRVENFRSCQGLEVLDPAGQTVAITGPAASGKSCLYEAFVRFCAWIRGSDCLSQQAPVFDSMRQSLSLVPFGQQGTVRMEAVFTMEGLGGVWEYGFAVKDYEVEEEWLHHTEPSGQFRTVFDRIGMHVHMESEGAWDVLAPGLHREVLLSTIAGEAGLEGVDVPFQFAQSCFWSNLNSGFHGLNKVLAQEQATIDFMAQADGSIAGFQAVERNDRLEPALFHEWADGTSGTVLLEDESDTVRRLLNIYPRLQQALDVGNVLFLDDLDRLPMKIQQEIVSCFSAGRCQLLYTCSHADTAGLAADIVCLAKEDGRTIIRKEKGQR